MSQAGAAAYSAGAKVYGSGRPHPTSGPVDPSGYVERSMNKDASNRRSGLAAAAGRRLQNKVTNEQSSPQAGPQPVHPTIATALNPITLADGRRVAPNATGQFEWVIDPGEVMEG